MIPIGLSAASLLLTKTGDAAKKVLEVAIPATGKAAKLTFRFIKGGVEAVREGDRTVTLSKESPVISTELSLPSLFFEEQRRQYDSLKVVNENLSLVYGQNELMFLSESIQYFVQSHIGREGVDKSISDALQFDILAAAKEVKVNEKLRFPGYLKHMCESLAQTIREYNLLYDAILNDGHIREWSLEEAKEKMCRTLGPGEIPDFSAGYIPYNLQIPIRRELKADTPRMPRLPKTEPAHDYINNPAHDTLFVLLHELAALESLEFQLNERVRRSPNQKLLIGTKSAFQDNN